MTLPATRWRFLPVSIRSHTREKHDIGSTMKCVSSLLFPILPSPTFSLLAPVLTLTCDPFSDPQVVNAVNTAVFAENTSGDAGDPNLISVFCSIPECVTTTPVDIHTNLHLVPPHSRTHSPTHSHTHAFI